MQTGSELFIEALSCVLPQSISELQILEHDLASGKLNEGNIEEYFNNTTGFTAHFLDRVVKTVVKTIMELDELTPEERKSAEELLK